MDVPIGGEIDIPDPKFDIVQWFPWDTALGTIAYTNEADVLRDAMRLVAKREATQGEWGAPML